MMTNVVTGVVAFAAYLMLAGTVSTHESIAAAVVAAMIACWFAAIRRVSPRHFAASRADVRAWMRAIASVPSATVRTGTALMAGSPMTAVECRFRQGHQNDPAERGRRATAVLAASLAPASFVVRSEPERDRVLVHAVTGARLPQDAERLA